MKDIRNLFHRLTAVGEPIPKSWHVALGALFLVFVLAAYTALSAHQHGVNPNDTTIPSWSQLAEGVRAVLEPQKRTHERWIVEDTLASGRRFGVGLGIGLLGAVLLGVHMGAFAVVEAVFYPVLTIASKIPAVAMFGIFFVLFGTDEKLYVAMVVFAVLPTTAQAIAHAMREFPEELRNKALTFGTGRTDLTWTLMFQYSLPSTLNATRLQVGLAMIALILTEIAVGNEGFGSQIRAQSRLQNMNVVFTYVAVLALVGFAIDRSIVGLQRALCPQLSGGAK